MATAKVQLSAPLMAVVKSGYDPTKLYIESTDRNGHYEQVGTKIPPAVEAMIEQAVAGNPGYKSRAAFVRDAIIHRLAYIEMNPGATIDPLQMRMEIVRHEMQNQMRVHEQIMNDLKMFDQVMEQCLEVQEWSMMNTIIERYQEMLDSLPNMAPGHREMIEEAIEDAMEAMSKASDKSKRRR